MPSIIVDASRYKKSPQIYLFPPHCKAVAADNWNLKTQLQVSQPLWLKLQGISTYTPSDHCNLGFTWQLHAPDQSHPSPHSLHNCAIIAFSWLYLRFPLVWRVCCFSVKPLVWGLVSSLSFGQYLFLREEHKLSSAITFFATIERSDVVWKSLLWICLVLTITWLNSFFLMLKSF